MKKRSLLLIALIAVLCLSIVGVVACKPNEPVDPDKQSIEISNAMALAAKWNVGEADRTVEVKLSDGLKDKAVTLTAEPQGIVTIDGMKLTAAKNGTTVVTARVSLDEEHEYTDSVEIKVTYNYSLTISNKANLTKAFRLGDADREVTVALSDAIKNNQVDIKSSNTNAVTVVNGKLHAQATGESTITATTSLNGVEFKDSFKVKVWGAFQFELTNPEDFTEPIGKNVTKEIKYAMEEEGDYTAADVNITSDHPEIVAIEGSSIKTLAVGTAKITVACGGITREFNVTVEVQPVLTLGEFDENGEYYTRQGNAFELPTIEAATNSQEQDVKANVQLVYDTTKLTITENEGHRYVWTDEIGRYTVTYKFADITGNPDKEVSVHFDVVDKLFSATGAHAGENQTASVLGDARITTVLEGEENNLQEIVKSDRNVLVFGKLAGAEAGDYYYAEATFAVTNPQFADTGKDALVGLGHFSSENERSAFISHLNTRSGDFINVNFEFNKHLSVFKGDADASADQTAMYAYKLFRSRHITRLDEETYRDQDNKSDGTHTALVKVAIARDGDNFYTFINDQYINCVSMKEFRAVNTVPAIIGRNLSDCAVKISGINYIFSKDSVAAKLVEVLGANKEKMIVPYAHSNSYDDGDYAAAFGDNVSIDTTNIANRGMAYNYINGISGTSNDLIKSSVSPNLYLDGNFTFQYDYKRTDIKEITSGQKTSGGDDPYRTLLEFKDYQYGNDILQLGIGSGNKNPTNKLHFYLNTKGYKNEAGWKRYGEPSTNNAGTKVNDLETDVTTRFTVTRILKQDHAEYIMTATVLDSNNSPTDVTYTRTIMWGPAASEHTQSPNYTKALDRWNKPVQMYWRNSGVSGEFSNIKWELLPDDIGASMVSDGANAITPTRLTETTTPDDGTEPIVTNLDQWKFSLNAMTTGDCIFDLGENALQAGEYTVSIYAVGDNTFGAQYTNELLLAELYPQITITVAEGDRYLKLNGLTLGHGTYNITLTKVVEPTPDPAPQEPTA